MLNKCQPLIETLHYSPSLEGFSILCHENKKCFLELKDVISKRPSKKKKYAFHLCLFIWVTSFKEALVLTQYTIKYSAKHFSDNEMVLKYIKKW